MIPRKELPDDAADWTNVSISFSRLTPDSAELCPEPLEEIIRYVQAESGDGDQVSAERLKFIRTALVDANKYWLWSYTEADETLCFVALRQQPDGSLHLGLSETNGLNPEQYLLADYYDEIYWS